MGQDLDALVTFREFFEAQRVGAPDVRSGIATVHPYVGRGPMQVLLRDHPQAQIARMPDDNRFGLRLRISPSPSTDVATFAAADSWGVVRQWIATHMMAGTRYRSGGFPIHFLDTDPPVFSPRQNFRCISGWRSRPYPEARTPGRAYAMMRADRESWSAGAAARIVA
jgi:hypothetical protein